MSASMGSKKHLFLIYTEVPGRVSEDPSALSEPDF